MVDVLLQHVVETTPPPAEESTEAATLEEEGEMAMEMEVGITSIEALAANGGSVDTLAGNDVAIEIFNFSGSTDSSTSESRL